MLLRVHLDNSVVRSNEDEGFGWRCIPHYSPVSDQCLLEQVCSACETLAPLECKSTSTGDTMVYIVVFSGEPNESKQYLEVFQLVKALWGREKQRADRVEEEENTLCESVLWSSFM